MNEFKKYRRKNTNKKDITEMTPVIADEVTVYRKYGVLYATEDIDEDLGNTEVKISLEDLNEGSPKIGDMIARDTENHIDQWLVGKDYFKVNFEEI